MLLFVLGATRRMTMTYISFVSVLQVLFEACNKESDLTLRKTRGYNESAWTDGISKVHLLRQLRAAYIQSRGQYNFDEMRHKDCSLAPLAGGEFHAGSLVYEDVFSVLEVDVVDEDHDEAYYCAGNQG